MSRVYDAVVVGGGYFGIRVAEYLASQAGFHDIALVEAEPALMTRASLRNQGRVHQGYHYPRSWTTAMGSRINLPRFVAEHQDCIRAGVTSVYAVSRRNSKVSSAQFLRFCRQIGAPIAAAPAAITRLFEPSEVAGVFVVEEPVLDVERFTLVCRAIIARIGIPVHLNTRVSSVAAMPSGFVELSLDGPSETVHMVARQVYNCTYSGLGSLGGSPSPGRFLKHELAELAVVRVPEELANIGVTVVDGSFFSLLPYGSRDEHTLSHVRYTPRQAWFDQPDVNPYAKLAAEVPMSHADRMIRAGARHLPSLARAQYVRSIYEVKSVLVGNESDDGRPILYLRDSPVAGCTSILGGKLDNVYDVLARLDEHQRPAGGACATP